MAVKITKTATMTAADMLKQYQKTYGEEVGNYGGTLFNAERIPTGLFELDLAMAGGFPRGKVSIIYGPESSGKTNCALLAIANHQRLWPHLTCAFFDIEHSFDPAWAKRLGVDTDKLLVIHPPYAEQAIDMIEGLLYAEDCGLIVLDSLAAMVTTSEADSSAEKAIVGGAALAIGKLTRKTTLALSEAVKQGRLPSLIYINQISFKVGVMFGDPETQPGGTKPRHQSAMTLRLYGKNKIDKAVSETMPVIKETKFIIRKWKCPIISASGEFDMITLPYKGLAPGMSDDFKAIRTHLEHYGQFQKGEKGKGWVIVGDHYDKIEQFENRMLADRAFGDEIRKAIFERHLVDNGTLEEGGGSLG